MKDNISNKNKLKDKLMIFLKECMVDDNISVKTYTKISGHVVEIFDLINNEYLEQGE